MKNLNLVKKVGLGAWGVLWLILALTFIIPGLGDNPAYDPLRYVVGIVFVVATLAGFGGYAWWHYRRFPSRKTGGAPQGNAQFSVKTVKTGADLPTILRDRQRTGGVPPAPSKVPLPAAAVAPSVEES